MPQYWLSKIVTQSLGKEAWAAGMTAWVRYMTLCQIWTAHGSPRPPGFPRPRALTRSGAIPSACGPVAIFHGFVAHHTLPKMESGTTKETLKATRSTQSDTGDLEFVFYQPNQPSERPTPDERSTWEKLVDRIGDIKLSQRLQVQPLLEVLPCNRHETPIVTALRLASSVSLDLDERKLQELLVITLCFVLYTSGRASPEEIDSIIGKFSSSSEMKYLNRLKRAGKIANEIIAEWAESSTQDLPLLYRLDCATQAVLQGKSSGPNTFANIIY